MKTAFLVLTGALLLFFNQLAAQSLTVTADTTICAGQSVQLNASGGGSSYSWSPNSGLNSPTIANPVATPTQTTTYVVTSQLSVPNMVVNGTFDAGNTGFTSGYFYQANYDTSGEQRYWVGSTPNTWNSGMASCGDHTGGGGNGNMLVANGATTANVPVWCQTFTVVPNSTYNLSAYIQPFSQTNLAKGQWMVNGTPIGSAASTVFTCLWAHPTATWNSGNNTTATFCLFNTITALNGNDFAIDDITITATLNLTDTVVVNVVTAPVVNIGADTAICAGQTLNLNATTANATYLWSNGATTPGITVNTQGQYWVRVNNGCIARDSVNVTVNPVPVPFSLGADTAYCGAFTRTLALNNTVAWNTGVQAPQIAVNAAGTYWAVDSNACGVQRDTIQLTQNPLPVVNLGADTSICTQSILLNAGTGATQYAWSDNSSNQTLLVNNTGTYSVTVTNALGCSATDAVVVAAGHLSFTAVATNTSCGLSNGAVNINNLTGTAPYSYVWNTGDSTASISGLSAGNYSVTVADANGCSSTNTLQVNPSGANSVSISTSTPSICPADSAQVCAPSGYNSYQWNTGDTSRCIYAKLAGNYYVTVTDAGNCTASSNHLAITVLSPPPVSITVNGDTLTAFNATAYQWYYNGTVINGATNGTYVATQTGNYSVQLADSNGCKASSNAVFITTGIGNITGDLINVYPNPNHAGIWNLQVGEGMLGTMLQVFDVQGQSIYQAKVTDTNMQIALLVPNGVYLLKLSQNQASYTYKLIKL